MLPKHNMYMWLASMYVSVAVFSPYLLHQHVICIWIFCLVEEKHLLIQVLIGMQSAKPCLEVVWLSMWLDLSRVLTQSVWSHFLKIEEKKKDWTRFCNPM